MKVKTWTNGDKVEVEITNWESQLEQYSKITEQRKIATQSDAKYQHMFRGDKLNNISILQSEYPDTLFTIGRKARPAYCGNDINRLEYTPNHLIENQDKFTELASVFVNSEMHKRKANEINLTVDDLVNRHNSSNQAEQFLLVQLLIYGLQYQNQREGIREWQNRLFVVSCSCDETVAMKYALRDLPQQTYVIEYAPPINNRYSLSVAEVIDKFKELNLGFIFPDRDQEIFVLYAMMPHYILGYAKLRQQNPNPAQYNVEYIPNPSYEEEGYTLDNPPILTEDQEELFDKTKERMAWVFRDSHDWQWLKYGGISRDISSPNSNRNG